MNKLHKTKVKLPISAYLLYLAIASFLLVGVSFSRYIVSTNKGDHARVAKFGELELVENDLNDHIYKVIPGVPLRKSPVINYTANEMSAYVYVSITAPKWKYDETNKKFTIQREATTLLEWKIDEHWSYLESENSVYIFYLEVPAQQSLNDVSIISNNEIKVSENIKASELSGVNSLLGNITIQAYAV